jgi:hypothetical protein
MDKGVRQFSREQNEYLLRVAPRHIWWKTPEEALEYPQMLLASIMNMGLWEDLCELSRLFAEDDLRRVLKEAEAGQFNGRSWHFWHYRLLDCPLGEVPGLPARKSGP